MPAGVESRPVISVLSALTVVSEDLAHSSFASPQVSDGSVVN